MPSKCYCWVCHEHYSFMGWAKHVAKEKRLHGEDIYLRLKAERNKDKPKITIETIKKIKQLKQYNKELREFIEE